jgi:hypothetical protein
MSSAKFTKEVAVIALIASADLSTKRGYLCKLATGQAALNDSATVPAFGVILDGEASGGMVSVGVLGGNLGTVKLKAGGAITQGAKLQQKSDGTVIVDDGGTTARVIVGIALEAAADTELFEAITCFPNKAIATVITPDGSDAGTTQTLANALKVALNAETAGE